MSWKDLLLIKKELLEEILKDFDEYEVTDPKSKAIISGKLQGLYNLIGEEK
jgi:hypothetical protein